MFSFIGKEVEDNFFDDYIEPKDYLPKRFHPTSEDKEISKGEKEKSADPKIVSTRCEVNSSNLEGPFLGAKEEVTGSTVKSHVAEFDSSGNLLLSKNIEQGHAAANDESPVARKEPINQLICNRLDIEPHISPLYLGKVMRSSNP